MRKHLISHTAADLRLIGYSKHLLECFLSKAKFDMWNEQIVQKMLLATDHVVPAEIFAKSQERLEREI